MKLVAAQMRALRRCKARCGRNPSPIRKAFRRITYAPKTWFDCFRFRLERGLPSNKFYAEWSADERRRVLEWMRGLFLWSDLHLLDHDNHAFQVQWSCDLPLSCEWASRRGLVGVGSADGRQFNLDSKVAGSLDEMLGATVSMTRSSEWKDSIQLVAKHKLPMGTLLMTESPCAYVNLGRYAQQLDADENPGLYESLQSAAACTQWPHIDRVHPKSAVFSPKYEYNDEHLAGFQHPVWEMVDSWLRYAAQTVADYKRVVSQLPEEDTDANNSEDTGSGHIQIDGNRPVQMKTQFKKKETDAGNKPEKKREYSGKFLKNPRMHLNAFELVKDFDHNALCSVVAHAFTLRLLHQFTEGNCPDPMGSVRFDTVPSAEVRAARGLPEDLYPASLWSEMFAGVHMNAYVNQSLLLRQFHGHGLYSISSLVDHSCDPNLVYAMVRGRLRMVTTRNIDAGEVLTTSYIAEVVDDVSAAQRRARLRALGFNCHCERCLSTRAQWAASEHTDAHKVMAEESAAAAAAENTEASGVKAGARHQMSIWSELRLLHHILNANAGERLRNPVVRALFRDRGKVAKWLMKHDLEHSMVNPIRDCFQTLDVLYGDAAAGDELSHAVLKNYKW